jgi:hypothetical protein
MEPRCNWKSTFDYPARKAGCWPALRFGSGLEARNTLSEGSLPEEREQQTNLLEVSEHHRFSLRCILDPTVRRE